MSCVISLSLLGIFAVVIISVMLSDLYKVKKNLKKNWKLIINHPLQ